MSLHLSDVLAQFLPVYQQHHALNWQQQLLTVSGGKWTTARALAQTVVSEIVQSNKV